MSRYRKNKSYWSLVEPAYNSIVKRFEGLTGLKLWLKDWRYDEETDSVLFWFALNQLCGYAPDLTYQGFPSMWPSDAGEASTISASPSQEEIDGYVNRMIKNVVNYLRNILDRSRVGSNYLLSRIWDIVDLHSNKEVIDAVIDLSEGGIVTQETARRFLTGLFTSGGVVNRLREDMIKKNEMNEDLRWLDDIKKDYTVYENHDLYDENIPTLEDAIRIAKSKKYSNPTILQNTYDKDGKVSTMRIELENESLSEDLCDLFGCEIGFFTKDDLMELIDDINEKCPKGLEAVEAYMSDDDKTIEVVFNWDEYGQDSVYKRIDYRGIRKPSDILKFTDELIQMGKDKLGYISDEYMHHLDWYAGITDESLEEDIEHGTYDDETLQLLYQVGEEMDPYDWPYANFEEFAYEHPFDPEDDIEQLEDILNELSYDEESKKWNGKLIELCNQAIASLQKYISESLNESDNEETTEEFIKFL